MQNKLSLLRFYPHSVGRPATCSAKAERAIHEAIQAGADDLQLRFKHFTNAVKEDGSLTILAELYDHLKMVDVYVEFPLTKCDNSMAVMYGTYNHNGRIYNLNYHLPAGELYIWVDKWDSNMGKFLVAGTYVFEDNEGNEYPVEVTKDMFNLPWVPHSLKTDQDRDPVHPSLEMLCLKHSDWTHAQFLKDCPNLDPMTKAAAHLASSFETVDGVFYSFDVQPTVDWVYIWAKGKCVYRVVSSHNGRVTLRNEKTNRLFYCNMHEFKNEFIRTSKEWNNADPTATANQGKHNPRVSQ